MSSAYIIFCNDMPVYTIVDDVIRAETKKEELAQQAFQDVRWNYQGEAGKIFNGDTPYEKYRHHCYWHVHQTACEVVQS